AHDKLHRRTDRAAVSRGGIDQHRVTDKVQANGPAQMLVAFVEPALHQIAYHRDHFLDCVPLRRHLRFMADGHECTVFLFNFEDEFLLHARQFESSIIPKQAGQCAALPDTAAACSLKDLPRPVGAITESMMPRWNSSHIGDMLRSLSTILPNVSTT